MGGHRFGYRVCTGDYGSCSVIDIVTGFPAEVDVTSIERTRSEAEELPREAPDSQCHLRINSSARDPSTKSAYWTVRELSKGRLCTDVRTWLRDLVSNVCGASLGLLT